MKSIADLAEQLGVTPAIMRSWQINLNLEQPRYAPDALIYDAEWEAFFAAVARLRKEGKSFSKIKSSLAGQMPPPPKPAPPNGNGSKHPASSEDTAPDSAAPEDPAAETPGRSFSFSSRERRPLPVNEEAGQALVQLRSDTSLAPVQHLQRDMHEALITQDLSRMAQTYLQLMENYQTLAARYSESTYVLGQLEEKNRALEAQLQDKQHHFADKEATQQQRIQELENHLQSLKQSLARREDDLEQHQDSLVTKDQIALVEKQIKMLAVTVFQQQEQQAEAQKQGFWQRLTRRWR